MMDEYSNGDLMAAIIDLKQANEAGLEQITVRLDGHDKRFDELEFKMNRRFDRVDERFDEFAATDRSHERRIQRLEDRVFDRPAP